MKVNIIYHSADPDGWLSAAIVRDHYIAEETTFTPYNYGDKIIENWWTDYDTVVILDVSFSFLVMSELYNRHISNSQYIIWIDHHISAIRDSEKFSYDKLPGIRNELESACYWTWIYYKDSSAKEVPEFIKLISGYDSWSLMHTKKRFDAIKLTQGMYYEFKDHNIDISILTQTWRSVMAVGEILYNKQKKVADGAYHKGRTEWEINGKLFYVVNGIDMNPKKYNINYKKDGYDGGIIFRLNRDKWVFTIYSDTIDCTEIAGKFNGGGHAGAAGWISEDIETFMKAYGKE